MPSKTVHLELTTTALSLETWSHLSRIDKYIIQHIADPDTAGMQDGYILRHYSTTKKGGIVPHHGMKEITQAIHSYYFWNSICYYLKGDYEKAGESLARALHYAQDMVLVYSGSDPRHNVIESQIDKVWSTQKEFIIKEVLSEFNEDKVSCFEETSTPKQYLNNAFCITYYWLKRFEKIMNLASTLSIDKLKEYESRSRRRRVIKSFLGISSVFLFPFSLCAITTNATIGVGVIGIIVSIAMFVTALKIRPLMIAPSLQGLENEYLLWTLGYKKLDLTKWEMTKTKRIGRKYRTLYYTLILQPYVKPCHP